jgi:membrane dipeptidase
MAHPAPLARLVVLALLTAGCAVAPPGPSSETEELMRKAALSEARRLLDQAILVDGHNDLPWAIRTHDKAPGDVAAYDLRGEVPGQTDLARLKEGRVGAQFWSVYVPGEGARPAATQLEQIELARRMIARYPEALQPAGTVAEIRSARADGRIASLLGIEGGHAIENSMGALRAYYELGARYMTLTHNTHTDWADSAAQTPARHGGLSKFGVEVVREMNRLGMLVDLSHVSEDAMNDALAVAEAPVIFSHSNARALSPTPRNVPDAVLARLAKNGGVVMVSFISLFAVQGEAHARWQESFERETGVRLGDEKYDEAVANYTVDHPEPRATIADVADHVEHVREVAGIDHVGVGADFFGEPGWMAAGLEDVSRYPELFAELIRRGWSEEALAKLARGNLLRAMREAEQAAARLQRSRPASYVTIEEVDGGKALPDLY